MLQALRQSCLKRRVTVNSLQWLISLYSAYPTLPRNDNKINILNFVENLLFHVCSKPFVNHV